ncbi:TPA: hypothetical protein PC521_001552 [Klebsiella michiganensis]|nr:hypothetical protein [Klebsiella michiganensis]
MANLDKDLNQKQDAIRFCLINGYIPFLEVNVENYRELSDTSTIITDVDVLGVAFDITGKTRKVIFDCKTLKSTSPINRAFWASGVMHFLGYDEAFIILRKKSSEAHRLSAKTINVHLFDEEQMKGYAQSFSMDFNIDYSYSTDINNWVKISEVYKSDRTLQKYGDFLTSSVPTENDPPKNLRRFIAALQKIKNELDPQKNNHRAIYYHSLMNFSYIMACIIQQLRGLVDFNSNQEEFTKLLKYYIWGGKDGFILRNKMREILSSQNNSIQNIEPELRNWDEFIELTRSLLDSPNDISSCCHVLREFSFSELSTKNTGKDDKLSLLISNNVRVRQYIMILARYLTNSLKMPKDFINDLTAFFDRLR